MSRFWLVIFPFVIWPCAAYAAWRIYQMVTTGNYVHWTDTIKLVAFLMLAFAARGQAKRKYDEQQANKRALREWAAEEDSKSGKSGAPGS